jgi:hypothetical protein
MPPLDITSMRMHMTQLLEAHMQRMDDKLTSLSSSMERRLHVLTDMVSEIKQSAGASLPAGTSTLSEDGGNKPANPQRVMQARSDQPLPPVRAVSFLPSRGT